MPGRCEYRAAKFSACYFGCHFECRLRIVATHLCCLQVLLQCGGVTHVPVMPRCGFTRWESELLHCFLHPFCITTPEGCESKPIHQIESDRFESESVNRDDVTTDSSRRFHTDCKEESSQVGPSLLASLVRSNPDYSASPLDRMKSVYRLRCGCAETLISQRSVNPADFQPHHIY